GRSRWVRVDQRDGDVREGHRAERPRVLPMIHAGRKRHMATTMRWLVGLLVVALSLGSAEMASAQKAGGTLVMVHTDPGVMNPILEAGWPHFPRLSFNGLVDYDSQGNIVPSLAPSWQISPDTLTYTFQVRKHVRC